ncbi:MAG: M23 family metallopeptidase [Clostridia bacterium]|nr:M23 family metallopeptidase [Clostridia bacterium]
MRPVYTNQPINKPVRRREPAFRTLAVMSVVLAMMFGVRLFYAPAAEDPGGVLAAGARPQSEPKKLDDGVILVSGTPDEAADPVAACMASGGSCSPHDGEVTSGFALRSDPLNRAAFEFHRGMDIAGEGAVRAWSGGTVESVGEDPSYGNYVTVRHSGRIVSLYAHLASVSCAPGDPVRAGDEIGTAGSTGDSTGVHLHFEIQLDGEPVDPAGYLGK